MIKIDHIDKYFNRFKKNKIHVINNTSLELEDKGLVALLGPSGSGKTTLLNVIGGLDKVRKGKIYINGKKITNRLQWQIDKIRNLNIGYIFQDYKLVEDLSVYDNVSLSLKILGIKDKKEIDKRVTYVLDKVGMLRYKKRPCSMLSGGERQRVGIARAIVKNPNIIIADEPTGNLDSKNSLEIMKIIKAISKDKLVILVTHETNLAKFYASRIIELEDGKVLKDYQNENESDLEYEIGNTLYLKDFQHLEHLPNKIDIYSNEKKDLNVKIVIQNNNIYIKTDSEYKIEVVDNDSTIEMLDEHFKTISKEEASKYQFDFQNIVNTDKKLRYSSIFNPINFITNSFKKVFNYPILKKILLIGFFLSGVFVLYATSSIASNITIKDENFVTMNQNYLLVEAKKLKVADYHNLENNLSASYLIPTNSTVNLKLLTNDFYQFNNVSVNLEGSLTSSKHLEKSNIIKGRMPENNNEIVVDKMVLTKALKEEKFKMLGFQKLEDFLDREIVISKMSNMKIVGMTSQKSPSIYVPEEKMINIIYHTKDNTNENDIYAPTREKESDNTYDDYTLYTNDISLKEGRYPENDYEVLTNYNNKESEKLNKEINKKINGQKLKVVGYYTSKDFLDVYLVNGKMIKDVLISNSSDISIYTEEKENTLREAHEKFKINIKDSYQASKDSYLKKKKESIKSSLVASGIILIISLIEIFLMIRSSFLSRVKEVGIYRAIGVKKKDIYTMFSGEIIAITILATIPGILFCSYILYLVSKISMLNGLIIINPAIILISIISTFIFNLFVGLIPVFNTLRKRPAEILSRTDI